MGCFLSFPMAILFYHISHYSEVLCLDHGLLLYRSAELKQARDFMLIFMLQIEVRNVG